MNCGTCSRCGEPFLGPIAGVDEVKWSLGHWIVSDVESAKQNIESLISSTLEAIRWVELNSRLKQKADEGLSLGYFTDLARSDLREIIDEMDKVSAGTRHFVGNGFRDDHRGERAGDLPASTESAQVLDGSDSGESFPPIMHLG